MCIAYLPFVITPLLGIFRCLHISCSLIIRLKRKVLKCSAAAARPNLDFSDLRLWSDADHDYDRLVWSLSLPEDLSTGHDLLDDFRYF